MAVMHATTILDSLVLLCDAVCYIQCGQSVQRQQENNLFVGNPVVQKASPCMISL